MLGNTGKVAIRKKKSYSTAPGLPGNCKRNEPQKPMGSHSAPTHPPKRDTTPQGYDCTLSLNRDVAPQALKTPTAPIPSSTQFEQEQKTAVSVELRHGFLTVPAWNRENGRSEDRAITGERIFFA